MSPGPFQGVSEGRATFTAAQKCHVFSLLVFQAQQSFPEAMKCVMTSSLMVNGKGTLAL